MSTTQLPIPAEDVKIGDELNDYHLHLGKATVVKIERELDMIVFTFDQGQDGEEQSFIAWVGQHVAVTVGRFLAP